MRAQGEGELGGCKAQIENQGFKTKAWNTGSPQKEAGVLIPAEILNQDSFHTELQILHSWGISTTRESEERSKILPYKEPEHRACWGNEYLITPGITSKIAEQMRVLAYCQA